MSIALERAELSAAIATQFTTRYKSLIQLPLTRSDHYNTVSLPAASKLADGLH